MHAKMLKTLPLIRRKPRTSPRSFDTPSPPSPVSTLRISIPDVLPQDISRRIAELDIGAKNKIVDAISQERLEFKNLWNRSLPINRLPNELLVQIFVSGVHSELFDSDSDLWVTWRRGPPPSFSKIMGTCRLWRDIILGTPALWCTVNLEKNPKWTEVCLARSVAAPLEVWAQVPFPCCPARFRAAYPVVHRIRSLYLGVSTQFGDPVRDLTLPLLFGDGMPVLEELDLAITHGMYRLPIGVDLTSRRFPRLRSLTLASMVAPQDTPLYAQLRTLSLTTCSHHLSFDRFLDTLALCTRLEELCLKDTLHHLSGDWMQGDPGPGQPLVSLPRLDRLALSNHGCACTSRFLARLHIQPSVRLELSADIDAASPDGSRSIAAMLPPSHALGTLEPLATVSDVHMRMASDPGSKSVWIHTGPSTPGETGSTTSTSLRMGLAPRGPHNDPHAPCEWLSVSDLVGLLGRSPARVTSLSVTNVIDHPDAVAAWAGVFRAFPLLERLSINGESWTSACLDGMENAILGLHAASTVTPTPPADSDPGCASSASDSSCVACPKLAHVTVDGLGTRAVYEAMRTCVRYRADRGAFLARLDLDLGSAPSLAPALCRAYVQDIVPCTERLSLRGVSVTADEGEEDGNPVKAAEPPDPVRRQGGKQTFKSYMRRFGERFGRVKLHGPTAREI